MRETMGSLQSTLMRMQKGASWGMMYGVSLLCGIGFTMSLFIGGLALETAGQAKAVRLGLLSGSVFSELLGYFVLKAAIANSTTEPEPEP